MDATLQQQLVDAKFPIRKQADGKAWPLTIGEIYAKTGKLYTSLRQGGWICETIDGDASLPAPSWEQAGAQIYLDQQSGKIVKPDPATLKPATDIPVDQIDFKGVIVEQ